MEHNTGAWGGRGGNPWGRGRGASSGVSQRPTEGARGHTGTRQGPPEGAPGRSRGTTGSRGGNPETGRGRGAPRGGRERGRGAQRGLRNTEQFDVVKTRPEALQSKQAVVGTDCQIMRLKGNYFKVDTRADWCVFHYHVDFKPELEETKLKKELMRRHEKILGGYVFDGASLYVAHRLTQPMELCSDRTLSDGKIEKIQMCVKLVGELAPTDVMYLQIFNIVMRKCLEGMGLKELNRNFFNPKQAITLEEFKLELWPGFKTSMRNREHDILLEVELATKVIRLDNCFQVIDRLRHIGWNDLRIKGELMKSVVITKYNNRTYQIDDIDYKTTPSKTFKSGDEDISFIDYYQQKYNLTIENAHQPMLVSRPKKRDLHRGNSTPILLVPELCQMTGLNDEMRQNRNLMQALAKHMNLDPNKRQHKLSEFIAKLQSLPAIQDDLNKWGLKFQNRLVECAGHKFPKQTILFGDNATETPNEYCDWGHALKSKPMLSTVSLRTWALIVPSRDAHVIEKLVKGMQRVSKPLQFPVSNPCEIIRLADNRPTEYARAVDTVMNKYGDKMQMIFAILPKQADDTYQAVKKRACVEFGIPSQCFVAKNAFNDKSLMSICTKVAVQLNAKLGGEPWTVKIPLQKLMVVGFDVYHPGKGSRGPSMGAMVATTSSTQAKYFSCASQHSTREEVSANMGLNITKCLHAYQKNNQFLPDRIILYRDGVGEGQLQYVHEAEVKTVLSAIESVYKSAGREPPKFGFIVVTKRINTRIFNDSNGRLSNPPPGTAVDDVITLPERYDFYLVSQYTKIGTVSPVAYNVLYDTMSLPPNRVQELTFKLCHLYFNWSGTVKVPAPCQYAHKLAYLCGLTLSAAAHERLANVLYFL